MFLILTADTEACGKDFLCDVLRGIPPEENLSGFEPDIPANVPKARWRAYEEAVSCRARMHEEGSKNDWWDFCRAIRCILKYNLTWSSHGAG
jgi:hypothetical protein